MPPKTRFLIQEPGKSGIGGNTAGEVIEALIAVRNAQGITVEYTKTGLNNLNREEVEKLANADCE